MQRVLFGDILLALEDGAATCCAVCVAKPILVAGVVGMGVVWDALF